LQALHGQGVVLLPELDVVGVAMGVEEDHIFGEFVIVVDDVLEVDVGFFALVHLNGIFRVGFIDHVDRVLPSTGNQPMLI
jgi:hypothetical protein